LDSSDNQKTINERQIANERLTLEARQQIANETVRLIEESFNAEIEAFEELSGATINQAELLALNNEELLNYAKNLELSDAVAKRFLEVVRDQRTAQQDLIETQRELTQAQQEAGFDNREEEINQETSLRIRANNAIVQSEEERAAREIQIKRDEQQAVNDLRIEELENELLFNELSLEQREEFETELTELITEQERLRTEDATENAELRAAALQAEAKVIGIAASNTEDIYKGLSDVFGEASGAAKAAFLVSKAVAFAQNIIQTQLAAAQIAAAPEVPIFGKPFLLALNTASGIARGATIAATTVAGFEKGGVVEEFANGGEVFPSKTGGFIRGNRHSNGGVKFRVGGKVNEAEGGEIILTRNVGKSQAGRKIASDLNASFGGARFQAGGAIGSSSFVRDIENNNSTERLIEAIQEREIVQVVNDFTDVQDEQTLVENRATV